ncbi:restriction endonuclease subunit S [Halopseudomonas pachastrellae]|nr:restriction endonuclease subunit S [Halopseudomonas pachastrellae]
MSGEVELHYKQSELGLIPVEWTVKPISDCMRLINGRAFKPSEWASSGVPIIRIQNLNNPFAEFNYYPFDDIEDRHRIKPGDLVFAWSGTLGSSFGARSWAGPEGVLNQHIFKVIPDAKVISPEYALIVFKRIEEDIAKKAHGFKTSFVHIKKADLDSTLLPLPCHHEQKAIALALKDIEALISSLDQLIAKKRDIQQATMQQLLTGQRRLPGFSGEWEVKRLGDLVSRMANGCVYTPDEKNGVPITRIETISDGTINWNRIGHAKPSPEIESYKIQHGDILYSHINSIDHIGKVARYSDCKPLYHGMNLILLRPNSNIDSDFLFFLLSSETIRRTARTLAKQAVSQASINTKELRALELTIPDVGEQIAVASTLSDMDAELAALESRRDKARQLKQGMMQELLSGRIRLA